jgi:two-component system response regulator AtoC
LEETVYGTTVESLPVLGTDDERLFLAVIGDGSVATYPLPDSGALTIGRLDSADVFIDDPLVSRQHARIEVDDDVYIEDLGGTNGTFVSGRELNGGERTLLEPGQVVEIAGTLLVVQRQTNRPRARRLWPQGYFEMRLEESCGLEGRGALGLAVLWLDAPTGADREAVEGTLSLLAEPTDLIGRYAEGQYEVLLFGGGDRASRLTADLIAHLDGYDTPARVGVAQFPKDGRTPDALIAAARQRARGATSVADSSNHSIFEDRPIVEDHAMVDLFRVAERVARGKIGVLILGETGVGKEVLAAEIHRRSPRASKPFVRLNCGAFSPNLLESELFGYEKGAFTGADQPKPGLLEHAHGGTVFLDELGELPLPLQVKLLRVLEQGEVQRLGALTPKAIDVRYVSATNRDLEKGIRENTFREDLYFRLCGVSLTIPPLRERKGELMTFARAFLERAAEDANTAPPKIEPEAQAILERYDWPGNLRELKNAMERAVLLSTDGRIGRAHLPVEKMSATWLAPPQAASPPLPKTSDASVHAMTVVPVGPGGRPLTPREAEERERVVRALEAHAQNQTRAARALGISRQTLVKKIEKYDLPRPRKR